MSPLGRRDPPPGASSLATRFKKNPCTMSDSESSFDLTEALRASGQLRPPKRRRLVLSPDSRTGSTANPDGGPSPNFGGRSISPTAMLASVTPPPPPPPAPARQRQGRNAARWTFTYHPPLPLVERDEQDPFVAALLDQCNRDPRWQTVFQLETGKEGRPHYQGYIERPRGYMFEHPRIGKNAFPQVHWETANGNRMHNFRYCSKEGRLRPTHQVGHDLGALTRPRDIKTISIDQINERPWQRELLELLATEPDERTIYWYWEPDGNMGKTAFMRYYVDKHRKDAVIVGGAARDLKFIVDNHEKEHHETPRVVFMDIPRCSADYVSFQGIEEVKNATFSANKYEGRTVHGAHSHFVVFANQPPDVRKMSLDRWRIKLIKPDHTTEDQPV